MVDGDANSNSSDVTINTEITLIEPIISAEEALRNPNLLKRLLQLFTFLEKSRQEIVTTYKNIKGLHLQEQILNHYTDGFNDMIIAFGHKEINMEERMKKLAHSEEHFLLYLTEVWEAVVVDKLNILVDYMTEFQKPFGCPKQYYRAFICSVKTKCDKIYEDLKLTRAQKIVSERIALETVDRMKLHYDEIYLLYEQIIEKQDYPSLRIMIQACDNKNKKVNILLKIIFPIITILLTVTSLLLTLWGLGLI